MPRKGKKGKRGKKGNKKAAPAAAAQKTASGKDKQKLPPREERAFKDVMKLYESKSYKKCIKTCDTILKKFPNHGETLSMKGLTLNCLGESEKAHEFCKRGLVANMKTHVTWHVYGLLYRAEKKYGQALRSYKQALKLDPKNMQIARDIALLQIQERDMAGLLETRNKLLQAKSNNKQNWLGFAVAQFLNNKPDLALEVIKSYKETLAKEDREQKSYLNGEIALFESKVIESMGDPNKVLEHLEKAKAVLTDVLEYKERKVKFLVKAGRFDDAILILRALMAENPENYDYHRGVQCCILKNGDYMDLKGTDLPVIHVKLTDEQMSTFLEMYDVLALQQPRCAAHRHIPLMFATGEAYKTRARKVLSAGLMKTKDTLFAVLKPIYDREIQAGTSFKRDFGLSYLLECEKSLEANNTLPGSTDNQTPTTLLSAWLFLAQHLDHVGKYEPALEYLEKAIAHTPTFVDLYIMKGKILKHTGDLWAAASAYDFGRKLDLADRYINCETTKYLLQAGRIEEAEKIVVLFSKTDGEYQASLFDMQTMWYETAAGQAHLKAKNYKMALKKFACTESHWESVQDSQLDFHSYCLRRQTLRAYLEMLDFEDKLGEHEFFLKGALGMVHTYLAMHKDPAPKTAEELAYEGMTKEQQRNYRRKQAKEKAKKDAEKKTKKTKQLSNKMEEPDEELLYNVDSPLAEAWKYVQKMQKRNPDRLETHLAHFDVAMAREQPAVAIEGLHSALKLCPEGAKHAEVMPRALQLFKAVEGLADLDESVKTELANERKTLLGSDSLSDVAKAYIEAHSSADSVPSSACSHASLVSACVAAVEVDAGLTDLAVSTLCGVLSSKAVPITAEAAVRAKKFLDSIGGSTAEKYRELLLAQFPRCLNAGVAESGNKASDDTAVAAAASKE